MGKANQNNKSIGSFDERDVAGAEEMVNIQSELMELRKQTDSATHLRLPLQSRSFGVLKPEWDPVLQDLASLMWLFIYTDTHHLIDTT